MDAPTSEPILTPPLPPTRLQRSTPPALNRRRLLLGYVALVVLTAGAVLAIAATHWQMPARDDGLRAAVLVLLFVFGNWRPRHRGAHTKITLDDVPLFMAALLLPVPLALAVVVVGEVPGQIAARIQQTRAGRQQPWFVPLFNIAYPVLQVRIGAWLFGALRPALPLDALHLGQYLGVVALMATMMYLTNMLLLAGAVGLQRRINPFAQWWANNWRGLVDHMTLFAIGLLGAVLGAAQWWEVLLVVLPMVSIFVSFDHAARAYLWQEAATRDVLTALYNRLYFFKRLDEAHRHAEERDEPCSLILIDLDGLKQLNDTYGHPIGDQALARAADFLREHTRTKDIVARIGGDEFAVLLPHTPPEQVEQVARRLREALPIPWGDGTHPPLQFSLGVAHLIDQDRRSPDARVRSLGRVIRDADEALYAEKSTHKITR